MKVRYNRYHKKPLSRLEMFLVVIVVASSVYLFVLVGIRAISQHDSLPPVVESVTQVKKFIEPGLPKQLTISSINLTVDIDYVGLTSDGVMDIKPNSEAAGWYMLGPRPGDKGSAVIAGHYGWAMDGEPAIFNDIQKLSTGDELSVLDQKGQSTTFVVREIRKYNPDSDASAVFKSNDGNRHLNLITCSGVWENDKQSYSDRLVVFTDIKS